MQRRGEVTTIDSSARGVSGQVKVKYTPEVWPVVVVAAQVEI